MAKGVETKGASGAMAWVTIHLDMPNAPFRLTGHGSHVWTLSLPQVISPMVGHSHPQDTTASHMRLLQVFVSSLWISICSHAHGIIKSH